MDRERPTCIRRGVIGGFTALAFLPLLLTATPAAGGSGVAPPAQQAPPAAYTRGVDLLEAGDTLGALVTFRALVKDEPRYGPGWLKLGQVLSGMASFDEDHSEERREAERAFKQALRIMPDDPVAHLELGILLRKQRILTDAQRSLERAWTLAEEREAEISDEEAARLHFTLGRIYEAWWEDWQELVFIPPSAEQVHCSQLEEPTPHASASVICASQWAYQYDNVVFLEDMKGEEWSRMLGHFDRALELQPDHVEAAISLLGHLADAGRWDEYLLRANELVQNAPDDPRSHLYLALGLHEQGRGDEAGRRFHEALTLMDDEAKRPFEDIRPLIPRRVHERFDNLSEAGKEATTELLFTGKDPLYLTDSQERRLEHYARVAWADLKFGTRVSDLRGWETARGNLWIRYGPPWRSYQCCYGDEGRIHYWSYGPRGPLFVFERRLTYRRAWLNDVANQQAEDLENLAPELYRPRSVTELYDMPHQGVRFMGDDPRLTRLELYAQPPLDSILAVEGAPIQAGVFVKTDDLLPVWEHRDTLFVSENGLALTYRVQLQAGEYQYGMEARLDGPESMGRPLARNRRDVDIRSWPRDRVALSDLLLAHFVEPRTDAPTSRAELSINPLRGHTLEEGRPLALYFEVYGLATDDEGFGSYEAELTVRDAQNKGVLTRLVEGAAGLFGDDDEGTRVTWERTVEVTGDRTMDFLTVELPDLEPGEYEVTVRLTDSVGGQSAMSRRSFLVGEPSPQDDDGEPDLP